MKKNGINKELNQFRLNSDNLQQLAPNMGYCFATNKITIEGLKVGYMYKEMPDDSNDSGWRFFSGTENQDYIDDVNNIQIFDVNTIANYDKTIIPYLTAPIGSEYIRIDKTDIFQLL
ncbi:MAG: DUF2185 domain-containing protein [Mediterranea massiliensis]|nr:DUF2185 domain-containing protein [Mediterranea massiliensis]